MNHGRLANYFMKPQASHKKGQESDSELSADVFCAPNVWHPEAQQGGLKYDADRAACLQMLAVLVGEAAGGDEVTGSISVSMDAEFDDFGFTVGPNLCLIRMTHKQVDLNDVYGCSNALARALKKHLKGQGTVDLLDLLKAVLSKGAFMWFAKQVIWWLGKLVDLMLMMRRSESRLADMTRDMGDRCLTRYWLAMRRSFDQTQWLSLGVDCGRIGKKNFWVGLAATPGNLGVVIPPLETMLPTKIPSTFFGGIPDCFRWVSCLWVVRFLETFGKTPCTTKKIPTGILSEFGGIPVRFFPIIFGKPTGITQNMYLFQYGVSFLWVGFS